MPTEPARPTNSNTLKSQPLAETQVITTGHGADILAGTGAGGFFILICSWLIPESENVVQIAGFFAAPVGIVVSGIYASIAVKVKRWNYVRELKAACEEAMNQRDSIEADVSSAEDLKKKARQLVDDIRYRMLLFQSTTIDTIFMRALTDVARGRQR